MVAIDKTNILKINKTNSINVPQKSPLRAGVHMIRTVLNGIYQTKYTYFYKYEYN